MGTPRIDRLDKNLIINGGFDFWQRGTLDSAITNLTYKSADRWRLYSLGGSVGTISKSSDSPMVDIKCSALFSLTTTAIGGTGFTHAIEQRIESKMLQGYDGKVCTLSFYYKTPNFNKVLIAYSKFDVVDDGSAITDFLVTGDEPITRDNTWRRASFEFTMPSDVSNFGMKFVINVGGSDSITTSDFAITGVMINIGSEQDFRRAGKNYQEEEQLCQRYYFDNTNSFIVPIFRTATNTTKSQTFHFPVRMRANPMVSMTASSGTPSVDRFSLDFVVITVDEGFTSTTTLVRISTLEADAEL